MKRLTIGLVALMAAACTSERPAPNPAAAQAELAEELAGLVAGPPVECVNLRDLRGNRTIGNVILFDGPGDTKYVNSAGGICPRITQSRAIRTVTPTTQLCRGEIITVFDPTSGMEYGGCGLGEFTPYRRP